LSFDSGTAPTAGSRLRSMKPRVSFTVFRREVGSSLFEPSLDQLAGSGAVCGHQIAAEVDAQLPGIAPAGMNPSMAFSNHVHRHAIGTPQSASGLGFLAARTGFEPAPPP
jgi:hypothetical protein